MTTLPRSIVFVVGCLTAMGAAIVILRWDSKNKIKADEEKGMQK